MCIDSHFVIIVRVSDCRIQTNGSSIGMINGADLESILVSSEESRLLSAIARCAGAHDGCLCKDTRSAIWVGPFFWIHSRKGDAILIILTEMKMSREPSFNAAMLSDEFNEFSTSGIVRVIEPTTAIDYMIFLQYAQTASIGWRMGKDKYLPSVAAGMRFQCILKPLLVL